MSCHARYHHTVCAIQGRLCHATSDIADRVCCQRAVMSCHARRCRPCVLSKGGDVMPCLMSSDRACIPTAVKSCDTRCRSTVCAAQKAIMACHARCCRSCVLFKGVDVMPHPTSSDCACSPREVISCDARHRSTDCAAQNAIMACHARRRSPVCAVLRR